MENLTINIASDHRGFALKSLFITRLKELGHTVADFGTNDETSCDAGDFAQKVALDIRAHPEHLGILICMSGQAMAMTANRYSHIRAALCLNTTMARLARQHNDANILVLGAHMTGQEVALDCLDTFLTTPFLGGRFVPRRDKLTAMGGL
ncbi:MAG: RpiB/LacA/LacB family sugar-phosphate isomerase [Alphaproteobacteria bacterium]|nr:RpiB/LacA/LacB family sugar-phosphate isomerase [Alphaproteobacteria bacterium]